MGGITGTIRNTSGWVGGPRGAGICEGVVWVGLRAGHRATIALYATGEASKAGGGVGGSSVIRPFWLGGWVGDFPEWYQ